MAASSAADRAAVTANLASFRRIGITRPGLRAASVAVCVLMRQDVPGLLITRRAAGLRNHSGQWALRGGSREPRESAGQAALRELREETGVGTCGMKRRSGHVGQPGDSVAQEHRGEQHHDRRRDQPRVAEQPVPDAQQKPRSPGR